MAKINSKLNNSIFLIQPEYANYRKNLFKILSKRHKIHFVFESSSSAYPGKSKPAGISHTFLYNEFSFFPFRLAYYLLKYKPDIVIASVSTSSRAIISFLYTIFQRKKFILWILEWHVPDFDRLSIKKIIFGVKYIIGFLIIRFSDSLIVGGTASKKYALSMGKKNDDIFMAMQCTDDFRKKKECKHQRAQKNSKKYTFLYMSRIIPYKGLDLLIKAFSLLNMKRDDVHLIVGGDGPFRPFCQNLSKQLNITNISFQGPIKPNEAFKLYEEADVFVLPSYFYKKTKYEAWGLVLNEALSMGLPIITTNAVGAAFDLVIMCGFDGVSISMVSTMVIP